jgi:hypothetical protein
MSELAPGGAQLFLSFLRFRRKELDAVDRRGRFRHLSMPEALRDTQSLLRKKIADNTHEIRL